VRSGSVRLAGEDVTGATPRRIVERGVGHVPEDRGANGLVQDFSVSDNLALRTYYREPFAHGWELDEPRLRREAEALVREHEVRTPGVETRAGDLSGGNQQKLVLAREFARPLKLLILDQPTRGLDIASVAFVHQRILAARDRGVAVLLVSAELDEVLALADRIAVMFGGRLVETLDARGATRERLGLLMAGAAEAGVA
jgi:simple sugar transport system ATP-binding protein